MSLRPVIGFEGRYSVTEGGRVWSEPRVGLRGPMGDKWLKLSLAAHGYLTVNLYPLGSTKPKHCLVHRLVASAWLPPPARPEQIEINHKDGIKAHCEATNLEWCTSSENKLHANRIGLIPPASPAKLAHARRNAVALRALSDADVKQVAALLACGLSQDRVAKRLCVSQATISRIHQGKTYKQQLSDGIKIEDAKLEQGEWTAN